MIEIIPNWHPLFVHFTIALLSMSVVFFLLEKPIHETEMGDNFLVFARYCLWLGVAISIVTVVAGWDAYNSVDHDTPSHTAMTDHRNFGLVTFAVFVFAALWLAVSQATRERANIYFVVVLLVGLGLLITTGNKGASLVYEYGLGVQSLPKSDDHGHADGAGHDHSHGDSHSEDKEHAHDDSHNHDDAHGHDDEHGHDDAHSHDSLDNPSSDEHSHDSNDAHSHDDLSMETQEMPVEPPAVEEDKDGITRQRLLPELPPAEIEESSDSPQ